MTLDDASLRSRWVLIPLRGARRNPLEPGETHMDRMEFNRRSSEAFRRMEDTFDEIDPDEVELDVQGGVFHVVFHDGTKFVVNSQSAAHQIWLAGSSQGWHFDWDAGQERWISRRNGDELFATLYGLVSEKLGRPIDV